MVLARLQLFGASTSEWLQLVFTPLLLIQAALWCSILLMTGSPLMCWSPAQFTYNYVQYANEACMDGLWYSKIPILLLAMVGYFL